MTLIFSLEFLREVKKRKKVVYLTFSVPEVGYKLEQNSAFVLKPPPEGATLYRQH